MFSDISRTKLKINNNNTYGKSLSIWTIKYHISKQHMNQRKLENIFNWMIIKHNIWEFAGALKESLKQNLWI